MTAPVEAVSPHPIHLADNAIYPLRLAEGGWLLIDAGPDIEGGVPPGAAEASTWELAVAQAAAIGFAPAEVRAVLVTHGHIDHAGLAHRWAGAGNGARILVGRGDVAAVAGGQAWQEAQRQRRIRELARHGCPRAILEEFGAWGRAALSGWKWEPPPERSIDAVEDGAELALAGGARLRVIAAPGHTPGNLVALLLPRGGDRHGEESAGALFTGDTLLPTTVPTPGLHFPSEHGDPTAGHADGESTRWPSLPPFLASVGRLRTLFDGGAVRRVLPGHGTPVEGAAVVERLFTRFETHHARRARRIRAVLAGDAGGPPDGLTAYEVARGLFPHLPPARTGQAMTEVIGHLDVLLASGEAVGEGGTDGAVPVRYRLRAERRA